MSEKEFNNLSNSEQSINEAENEEFKEKSDSWLHYFSYD